MEMTRKKISIVGCGPGSREYLTHAAIDAAQAADVVLGSARLLSLFEECQAKKVELPSGVEPALRIISGHLNADDNIAVLVSGSPGFFSLAKHIILRFGSQRCIVIPGISSAELAFARLGVEWSDALIVSAHAGRPKISDDDLAKADKIAVFAGSHGAMQFAADIARRIGDGYDIWACENLSLKNESVCKITLDDLVDGEFSPLTIVVMLRSAMTANSEGRARDQK